MYKAFKGFTITELCVTLSVLSVLTLISVPGFTSIKENVVFRQEVNSFQILLNKAKVTAIKTNSPVVVQCQSNGYLIYEDSGDGGGNKGDWVYQQGEKLLVKHTLPEGFRLTTNLSALRTKFMPTPGMKAGSIYLENALGKKVRIVINTVGRIRVD